MVHYVFSRQFFVQIETYFGRLSKLKLKEIIDDIVVTFSEWYLMLQC